MTVYAACQTVPRAGAVEHNIAEHLALAERACAEGANVVLFPELSLTGYEMGVASELAFSIDDARLAPLRDCADKSGVTLIVGAPVRTGEGLFIGALILQPTGKIDLYTKQRLGTFSESAAVDGVVPPGEPTVFDPGLSNPQLSFGEHFASVAICADTGRPAHAQAAADRGSSIYLASMFVIPSEFEREVANLESTAKRHDMLVAFANYGGASGGLASAGQSSFFGPTGRLVQLPAQGSGVVVAQKNDDGAWVGRAVK